MSSRGELFVTEDVSDTYRKELNKVFGKNWRLYAEGVTMWYDIRDFPDELKIDVENYDTDEKIGEIIIAVKKYIEDMGYGSYIEIKPNGLLSTKKFSNKYKIIAYLKVDAEKPEEEYLYNSLLEAEKEKEHLELLQPENIYKIEKIE